MKKIISLTMLSAAALTATAAKADVGITGNLGTTGAGLQLTVPVSERLNARFGANALNVSHDLDTSDVEYDLKLKLRTLEALLDYYPGGGNFRLSAGVVYNGNKLSGDGNPRRNGTYTLNGTTYTAASVGTLNAKVDFKNVAPYLGIGFGNAVARDKGWGFSADLGVMYQGSPKTSVTSNGCTAPAAVCARLASDIEAERRELQDDADDFKFYPVLRVGVNYRF